jgi:DNA-binding NtrC family response regulator
LIVEDDAFIAIEADLIVKELRHQVLTAHDVDQALSVMQIGVTTGVLFTDIRLKDHHLFGCDIARQSGILRADLQLGAAPHWA